MKLPDRFAAPWALGAALWITLLGPVQAAAGEAPPAGGLPAGVEELSADMKARLQKLQASAVKLRGLNLKRPVPMGQQDREHLRISILELFNQEMPAQVMGPMEHALKIFGLIPKEMDLATYYPALLTSQVAGYYDPKRKYLALVKEGAGEKKVAPSPLGPELTAQMDETAMVHEICHAIQDQHFDLEAFAPEKPMDDGAAAKVALIEGDATLVMYGHMLGSPLEQIPMIETALSSILRDPDALIEMMPDMPGAKDLKAAPAYLRENLLFSYLQGLQFCVSVRKTGGQALLDYAFGKDAPRSTEQILHPDKWLENRDDPVGITWPDLSATLPGFEKKAEGSWGEFNTRLLLAQHLPKDSAERCAQAAAGWGGDRFGLYQNGDREVVAWITEWDRAADAEEFFAAASAAFQAPWRVGRPDKGGTRVTLSMGTDRAESAAALDQALASAVSRKPENKRIDLAAVGAKEKGEAAAPEEGDGLEAGMAGLLKDPEIQKMAQQLLAGNQDRPEGSLQGKTYTNSGLGMKLVFPENTEWKINAHPEKSPLGPAPLINASSPGGQGQLTVMLQDLPMTIPIETLGPMTEMGIKMNFAHYQKVHGDFVTSGTQKGYELEYSGEMMGQSLHMIQRIYLVGSKLMVVVATSPQASWADCEKDLRAGLDGLTFEDPSAKTPAASKEGVGK